MRRVLIVVVVVLVAFLCGWLTFQRSPGRASFTIETDKISEDAQRAVEQGKRAIDEGKRRLQTSNESSQDR